MIVALLGVLSISAVTSAATPQWTELAGKTPWTDQNQVYGLAVAPNGIVYAVDSLGAVFQWEYQAGWTEIDQGKVSASTSSQDVSVSDAPNLMAVNKQGTLAIVIGNNQALAFYTHGVWVKVSVPDMAQIEAIGYSPDGTLAVVGQDSSGNSLIDTIPAPSDIVSAQSLTANQIEYGKFTPYEPALSLAWSRVGILAVAFYGDPSGYASNHEAVEEYLHGKWVPIGGPDATQNRGSGDIPVPNMAFSHQGRLYVDACEWGSNYLSVYTGTKWKDLGMLCGTVLSPNIVVAGSGVSTLSGTILGGDSWSQDKVDAAAEAPNGTIVVAAQGNNLYGLGLDNIYVYGSPAGLAGSATTASSGSSATANHKTSPNPAGGSMIEILKDVALVLLAIAVVVLLWLRRPRSA
jgi:hypothetical protein